MTLADDMLQRVGKTRHELAKNSTAAKLFRRRGVQRSSEFERVLYLPRRDWREGAEELAALLTAEYGRGPQKDCLHTCACRGTGDMKLKAVQAAAIENTHDFGGLFAPIAVGAGKTLVSFLTAAVIDAKRPMLLIPASLKTKTENDWWSLSVHWRLPSLRIETYEKLGVAKNAKLLEEYAPDLLFCDEAQALKNTSAAVTRRVQRFLQDHEAHVCIASGTLTNRTIKEYWHLLRWSLGVEQMPLPARWEEMMEWGECLDAVTMREGTAVGRMAPGCLQELTDKGDDLESVRRGYQSRLVESPGVVSTSDQDGHGLPSLLITGQDLPGLDVLGEHYARLRSHWQTPDGHDFSDAATLWRHARELVCGFYNVWDPRPPDEWMRKRAWWHAFARSVLKHSRVFDTEFQVASACARGMISSVVEVEDVVGDQCVLREADVYAEWCEIRDTFVPNPVPVWVDDTALQFAASWLEKHRGLCWIEHPCFGEKLSAMTGVPYYGRKGLDKRGNLIDTQSGPAIVSVLANNKGRNLQFAWSESLVVSAPPNATMMEQMIGRTHRDGQLAETVSYRFVLACREQVDGFYKSVIEAEYVEQTTGQPQRLLFADRDVIRPDDVRALVGARWR